MDSEHPSAPEADEPTGVSPERGAVPARVPRPGSPRAKAQQKRIDRRRFLTGAGIGLGVAALGAAGAAAADELASSGRVSLPAGAARGRSAPGTSSGPSAPSVRSVELPSGVEVPVADWVVAENARPGTLDWLISSPVHGATIEGYADTVSAPLGATVGLYVNTSSPTFHVEAYRMGYYGGLGGRLVWQSAEVAGTVQPPPVFTPGVNTVECRWPKSTTLPIGATWPPGQYLLKLVGSDGEQAFVPLCVRDDSSKAAFAVVNSVTTWQAYNRWGGRSLYYGPDGSGGTTRSRVVSFDRPYQYSWAWGAADFIGNEFPVVHLAERLGLDVTYLTDVDLHRAPASLLSHACVISLGHDEYWSTAMRDGAVAARDRGVNLAFLGANPIYRHIRLEPSPLGDLRHQVCYKTDFMREDPLWGVDPPEVSSNWETGPVPWPEQQLVGIQYADVGADADMVVVEPDAWVFAGTDLAQGSRLAGVVAGEYDRYQPSLPGPRNVTILAHSPVLNRGAGAVSDMSYYAVDGGGGVLAVGTASFVNLLWNTSLVPTDVVRSSGKVDPVAPVLERMMENVFSVFGRGPAGAGQPSTANWQRFY